MKEVAKSLVKNLNNLRSYSNVIITRRLPQDELYYFNSPNIYTPWSCIFSIVQRMGAGTSTLPSDSGLISCIGIKRG